MPAVGQAVATSKSPQGEHPIAGLGLVAVASKAAPLC